MTTTNIYLPTTIVHPLYDLQLKGGNNDLVNPSEFDKSLVTLGKRIHNDTTRLDKDLDMH